MFLTWLMLAVALSLSAIAAFYSIIGLTAIFAAAVIPVAVMGTILEIAKLTVTVWLHEYWKLCKRSMKLYLVPAVGFLMLITSMGIFGFLSKAHLDQAVPAGDISAQVSIYDEKIRTQRDNIEAARAALRQMDAAVDQTMSRTADEKGAERAVQIRRQQAAERNRLQTDIGRAQTEIQKLQEQRAPIAAQARKVEAEVGPIKYIAALIYGDNPDQNLLEKAVRWVIIVLVLVFDPLAIFMLLAATESYKWTKYGWSNNDISQKTVIPEQPINDSLQQTRLSIAEWWEQKRSNKNDTNVDANANNAGGDGRPSVGPLENEQSLVAVEPAKQRHTIDDLELSNLDNDNEPEANENQIDKQAKTLWKHDHPNQTLKEQRKLFDAGFIDKLPWEDYYDDPRIVRDVGFGDEFPNNPYKGDQWVLTNVLPTRLFKFNGEKWIEVDKTISDSYAYNQAYIERLIDKIGQGEYDPELLTEGERDQIEARLRQSL